MEVEERGLEEVGLVQESRSLAKAILREGQKEYEIVQRQAAPLLVSAAEATAYSSGRP